jgi:hypothetical protein
LICTNHSGLFFIGAACGTPLAQIWEDAKALGARGYRRNAAPATTAAAAAQLSAAYVRMTRAQGEHANKVIDPNHACLLQPLQRLHT